jgi:hypothetical protein
MWPTHSSPPQKIYKYANFHPAHFPIALDELRICGQKSICLTLPGDLKGQCREIFCCRFFHKSLSPKPLKITLVSFRNFPEIFKSQGTSPVSTTPVENLPESMTPVAKLPPVTTTLAANLPPVSTIQAENLPLVAKNGNNIRLQTP